ncbi:MAG: sodium:solute symporter [Gemmatimonadota bacterium]|jgi:SSS family solute:Na+ symporter|nr:sodium:solute symporter [Gemmatimonadota bacterium]
MSPLDLGIIVLYFGATLGLGLWVTRGQRTSGDYFLGARDLPAWAILLSIVATETSALTVISIPGIGARDDLAFLQLTFGYLLGRIGVAIWLLPGYFRGDQETAYTRLESRFGTGTRRLISAVFMVTRFLGDGVRVFAGAIPLALVTGWSVPSAILAMGLVTLAYTWAGGLKAVVWADVIQLGVYLAGGLAALVIAWRLAGGMHQALTAADALGRLRVINPAISFTQTYTLLGGLIGGAMLSAASHGTDHLIVQRLLATRSLRSARIALIGSGVVVIMQFLLFLLVGSAIWASGNAPEDLRPDMIFPRFVIEQLPAGISGLVIAGILAAAMSTISSSINALASSVTHDFYAGWSGRRDPAHLLKVGRFFTTVWGIALVAAAMAFWEWASLDTPVVVLALSVASVTYGALLGTYVLAGRWRRASGRDVILATVVTVVAMLGVVFAKPLTATGLFPWLEPAASLAWPWYVPLGTLLTLAVGIGSSLIRPERVSP